MKVTMPLIVSKPVYSYFTSYHLYFVSKSTVKINQSQLKLGGGAGMPPVEADAEAPSSGRRLFGRKNPVISCDFAIFVAGVVYSQSIGSSITRYCNILRHLVRAYYMTRCICRL